MAKGKVAYSARMRHMDVICGERLFEEFGKYMAMNPALAKNLVSREQANRSAALSAG